MLCTSSIFLKLLNKLIEEAIAAEQRRAATVEIAQWDRCFGPSAPKGAEQVRLVMAVASARALCAQLNAGGGQ